MAALAAWTHVIFASFLVPGAVVIAASAWHLARGSDPALFRRVMRIGLAVTLAAGIAAAVSGDIQARPMDSQQLAGRGGAERLGRGHRRRVPGPRARVTSGRTMSATPDRARIGERKQAAPDLTANHAISSSAAWNRGAGRDGFGHP